MNRKATALDAIPDSKGTDSQPVDTQFKRQVEGMSYDEQVKALQPPMPIQLTTPVQMVGGGSGSGGTAPARDLRTECQTDPVARQKWADVQAETAPRAVAVKADFISGATRRLNQDARKTALVAMRDEINGNARKYLCIGVPVPGAQIANRGGIARVMDFPSLYNHNYLKPSVKGRYANANAFVTAAQAGRFDPNADLDNRRSLRGMAAQTWWFPSNAASRVNLDTLRTQLYIQDNPNYALGAVRLEMSTAALQAANIEVTKPTAFDGAMQGWGTDPWWVPSSNPTWGVTKNRTPECVMRSARLRHFTNRSLMLPPRSRGGGGGSRGGGP